MGRAENAKILDIKEITEAKRYTLSCCIIARDEEEHIGRAIESVRDLADEVIVVDTGSADRTRCIAGLSGSRVHNIPWRDDFSEARNMAISLAAGSWILVLDADEELAPFARGMFHALIGEHHRSAFSMRQVTYTHTSSGYGIIPAGGGDCDAEHCFETEQVRIFPNDHRLRYVGSVHESIGTSLEDARIPVIKTDHIIHHYGRLAPSSRLPRKCAAYLSSPDGQIEVGPDDARYVYELAAMLYEAGEHEEAIAHAERGLVLEPDNWEFLNIQGMANLALGRLDEAEGRLGLAIEQNRSIPDLYNNIGVVLMEKKQARKALGCLERGIELGGGGNTQMSANAASACLELGFLSRALAHITDSIESDPFIPQNHAIHAEILLRMGDKEGSKREIDKIQFIPGTSLKMYLRVVHLYMRMGVIDRAEALLARSKRDHPGHDGLLYLSAKIHELKGEDERALRIFRSLVSRTPGSADLQNALGCVAERLGILKEALESFERAKEIDPRNPRIEMNIGIVKDRLGLTAEAETHLTNAIAMGERTGAGYNALGCHYAARGDYLEAVRCFSRAVEMGPGNMEFRTNLGAACRKAGTAPLESAGRTRTRGLARPDSTVAQ